MGFGIVNNKKTAWMFWYHYYEGSTFVFDAMSPLKYILVYYSPEFV